MDGWTRNLIVVPDDGIQPLLVTIGAGAQVYRDHIFPPDLPRWKESQLHMAPAVIPACLYRRRLFGPETSI